MRRLLVLLVSLATFLLESAALAQAVTSPRGVSASGLGLEVTFEQAPSAELSFTHRLSRPVLGLPSGVRFGFALPARADGSPAGVRLAGGMTSILWRSGDLALIGGLAASLGRTKVGPGEVDSLGLLLGLQGGLVAERAYLTFFTSARPTLATHTRAPADRWDALPAFRLVSGVLGGVAVLRDWVLYGAAGLVLASGTGPVPHGMLGTRVHF